RLRPNPVDEGAHHGQRHVGFQERDTHLAQRLLDVALGEADLAPQRLQDLGEASGEGFEHRRPSTGNARIFNNLCDSCRLEKCPEFYPTWRTPSSMPRSPRTPGAPAGGRPTPAPPRPRSAFSST